MKTEKVYKPSDVHDSCWLLFLALTSYILCFGFLYLRFTYFKHSENNIFPHDIMNVLPISNDLYQCVVMMPSILKTKVISGMIYSPFSLVFYNQLSGVDFNTLRLIVVILTLLSSLFIVFILSRQLAQDITYKPVGILLFILSLNSYGFKFELERGQVNVIILCITLVSILCARSTSLLIYILSLILFTFAVQMKIWPLIFVFCFVDFNISITKNLFRLISIIFINSLLLLCLGYQFMMQYIAKLISFTYSTDNIWIANMSINSFLTQYKKGLYIFRDPLREIALPIQNNFPFLYIDILKIIFTICFFGVIVLALLRRIRGSDIHIIYLCGLGSLVFPTTSYDYKLVIYYILTPVFLFCYSPIFSINTKEFNFYNKLNLLLSMNTMFYAEKLCISILVCTYPLTLFSYIYKIDYGIFLSMNTFPICCSIIVVLFLLFLKIVNNINLRIIK